MGKPYVMLRVPDAFSNELQEWTQTRIRPEALAPTRDYPTEHHLTLYYGLPEGTTAEAVAQVLAKVKRPLRTKITYAQYFKNSSSILVLICESKPLQIVSLLLNRAGCKPYSLTAHITLAYLRRGAEVPASGALRFVGREIVSDQLFFVDSHKNRYPLGPESAEVGKSRLSPTLDLG